MSIVREITEKNFEDEVLRSGKMVVLTFVRQGDEICRRMIKEVAPSFPDVTFLTMDPDQEVERVSHMKLSIIPVHIAYNGVLQNPVRAWTGFTSKDQFKTWVRSLAPVPRV